MILRFTSQKDWVGALHACTVQSVSLRFAQGILDQRSPLLQYLLRMFLLEDRLGILNRHDDFVGVWRDDDIDHDVVLYSQSATWWNGGTDFNKPEASW